MLPGWHINMHINFSLKNTVTILPLSLALCGMVSTIWFPIGVLHEDGLMSFGFSLYAGWVGSALCFFGGSVMTCCSRSDGPTQSPENRYYYSKHSEVTNSAPSINSHARSAHVWAWRQTHTLDKTSAPQDGIRTHTCKSLHSYTYQWKMCVFHCLTATMWRFGGNGEFHGNLFLLKLTDARHESFCLNRLWNESRGKQSSFLSKRIFDLFTQYSV